ncbi:MAG: LruC domain-containing protein [Bacteroidota bacterium]|nr:LruC domain-containing protein [Bacteroidota bacterium]
MKNLLNKLLFFALIMGLTISCQRNSNEDDAPDEKTMEDLIISDNFNYKNTKEVSISIQLPSTVDYSLVRNKINFYTLAPTEGGVALYSAIADKNGVFEGVMKIPAHLDSLYLISFAGNAYVQFSDANLKDGGVIEFDYNEEYGVEAPQIPTDKSIAVSGDQTVSSVLYHKSIKSGANLIGNPGFEINDFGTLSSWNNSLAVDGKWYFTNGVVGHAGQHTEGGDTFLRIEGDRYYGGVEQKIEAEAGDVVTFSADIRSQGRHGNNRLWLYLIPTKANGQILGYYNVLDNLNSNGWHTKTVTASMPQGTAYVRVLFWKWGWFFTNHQLDIDNVVVTGPIVDADGDGVNDDEDEYPNDSERAFNVYYPNETDFGSIGFEDNWPGKGDYDFNDLVVDYNFKQVLNGQNELVSLTSKYKLRAIGASFENGFGFQLGCTPDKITAVSGIDVPGTYVDLTANNTENGQSKATIIVFENAYDILTHPGGALGINTTIGAPYVEPELMTVEVTMATPVSTSITGMAPYNPFLIVDGERGREVHLPNNAPTDLAETSLFGTQNDNSIPSEGRYYKTEQNLPWAIDIPSEFAYPVEKVEIIEAYNHFVEWAESSGDDYDDWYLDETGYRNSDNIYSHE